MVGVYLMVGHVYLNSVQGLIQQSFFLLGSYLLETDIATKKPIFQIDKCDYINLMISVHLL